MKWSAPVNIGTNTGASGATLAITVPAAGVPTGATIFVLVTEKSTSGTNGTLADTASNTYSTITSGSLAAAAANGRGILFAVTKCAALVSGNTITYTRNLSASSCAMSAFYVTGATAAATFTEGVATATGTTGTITVTSGTLGAGRLVLGALFASGTSTAGGNATFTNAASFTTPPNQATTGGSGGSRAAGGTLFKAATGTQVYNPTLSSTAQQWFLAVAGIIPSPDTIQDITTDVTPASLIPQQPALSWTQNLLQSTLTPIPPDTTHILRPIWRSLPDGQVNYRIEQTWAFSYNPNLIGKDKVPGEQHWELPPRPYQPILQDYQQGFVLARVPVVTTGVTLRPPLYTQHITPTLLQTWVQSANLSLTAPTAAPFSQDDWPNPTQPFRLEQTWAWSYNQNLIAQDKMIVGEQILDRPQLLVPPDATLSTWAWKYNQNLIGKDRLPTGEQVYDLVPAQRPPPPENLKTWTWQYNPNLIGQDRLPVGEIIYDLTPSQRPPEQIQLHSWDWKYNLNLIGRDRLPFRQQDWPVPPPVTWYQSWAVFQLGELELEVPFRQLDWPNPTQPYRLDQTWATGYNKNLIAQDAMLVGQQAWVLPTQPDFHAQLRTWLQSLNPNLIVVVRPFAQFDWPLTPAPVQSERSITASYNPNLVAQDRMVTGEQSTDLPPRDFARLFQTWINTVNLALITAPESLLSYGKQLWELAPRGYPEEPRLHSWEFSYNRNLIGQDRLPFRQQDWPNPITPAQVKDWIQGTNLALTAAPVRPFFQIDWPLPTGPTPLVQTWQNTISLALTLTKPFAQYDWPLTPAPTQPDRSITSAYLKTLIGQDRLPSGKNFFDLAPRGPAPIEQTQAASYLKTLIGQDQLPNRQTDWPLSPGHITQLFQVTPAGTITLRFPAVPLPPGTIFTGRPELGPSPLLQQSVYEYNIAFIPSPTAPTLILRTLMGTGL